MSENTQDSVYSFVERAYMLVQAEEILTRCLEEGTSTQIRDLIDGLVLAGPENIDTLRDILNEADQRKVQLQDDLYQVVSRFCSVLKGYGLQIEDQGMAQDLLGLSASRLIETLQAQEVVSESSWHTCLQSWQDTREITASLATKLNVLGDVEMYLQDWFWGLVYQTVRRQQDPDVPAIGEHPL